MTDGDRKHVVIVGGGFGGLRAARALRRAPVRVTLIDRENHHLFQPLLYQVATAGLTPPEIATPIRSVLRRQKNARVLLGEVVSADAEAREVALADGERVAYDYLVVAAGAETNYFGHEEWAADAIGMKNLRDALAIRDRVLLAFEAAERSTDEERRRKLLTFVVIGGGPTGVELAGAISELGRQAVAGDFRNVGPEDVRVVLLEMAPRVLLPFDEKLSERARRQLAELGVEVRTGERVLSVDDDGVRTEREHIGAETVCWATGVRPVPLAKRLGAPTDAKGYVVTRPDCSIDGHPEVFVIGDIASQTLPGEERPLPGLAPVAMQQGRAVADNIRRDLAGRPRVPFRYRDKGMMATIGRSRAVAQSGHLKLYGLLAWLAWIFVHITYLIGFRNRVLVMLEWFWSYVTFRRGARLITRLQPGAHPIQLGRPTSRGAAAPPSDGGQAEVRPSAP